MKRLVIGMLAMVMGAVLVAGTGCVTSKAAKHKAKKNIPGVDTKGEKAVKDVKKSAKR
ncbi:MAG: hypothetical protein KAI74_03070 [Kiritimatiellae bacterium]|nr:hypothetical protein [Kiritimatiellia bacterium]